MKCVIIDDEPLAQELLKDYLKAHNGLEVVGTYNDGFEGLKGIAAQKPDFIFLDIQMPKINGFEMLELMEEPLPVIFTTAYDEFAIKAFEIHAVDYLLKPFSKQRLSEALGRLADREAADYPALASRVIQERVKAGEFIRRVVVKTGNKIDILPVSQIEHLSGDGDYVRIHRAGKVFLKLATMGYYEKALDPGEFVRIHRSHIVNLSEITKIEGYQKDQQVAILKDGTSLPVSKSGMLKLKSVLGI